MTSGSFVFSRTSRPFPPSPSVRNASSPNRRGRTTAASATRKPAPPTQLGALPRRLSPAVLVLQLRPEDGPSLPYPLERIGSSHLPLWSLLNRPAAAWLNNCVGHFNHRYFFSFCLYMTLGCVYCSVSSRNLFLEAYSAVEVRRRPGRLLRWRRRNRRKNTIL